jgi:hypothetical protein
MTDDKTRRRWINLGELIALLALGISAAGLWLTWKSSSEDKPTRVVEQRQAIPLTLRGKVEDDGRKLVISPVEPSHALQSMTMNVPSSGTLFEIGSDGELSARAFESALNTVGEREKQVYHMRVQISARYVEMGTDKKAGGSYVVSYKWEGGGLFGGRSLRLTGFSR